MRALSLVGCVAALWSLPATAQNEYAPPKQETLTPTGVSLQDGRFTFQNDDFSIGSLTLTRFHQGGKPRVPSRNFSDSWSSNFDIYEVDTTKLTFENTYIRIGRSTITFTRSPAGYAGYAPEAAGTSLTKVNGALVYTDRDYNVYTFNPSVQAAPADAVIMASQKIAKIVYANGRTLDFLYTNGKLTLVRSNDGFAIGFEINTDGNVSVACGFNLAFTSVISTPSCASAPVASHYSYATDGTWKLLTRFTDPLGHNWDYDYVQDNGIKLSCLHVVDSSQCRIQNSFGGQYIAKPGQVSQQQTIDGAVWNYQYVGLDPDNPPQPGQPFPWTTGEADGPEGTQLFGAFTLGFLLKQSVINGRIINFTYDGTQLTGVTYPEGNSLTYIYTNQGNATSVTQTPKPGSSLAAITSTRSFSDNANWPPACTAPYPRLCSKPNYVVDYNGNRTDYTWDPNSGLPLTETAPADAGGIRAVKRYSYVQRYAWISNGGGGYVQAAAPIWLVATEKTCRTTSTSGDACTGGSSDETVTTYDYGPDSGPNNLFVRGTTVSSGGATLRTCVAYDQYGNKISTTLPRAGLTSCP